MKMRQHSLFKLVLLICCCWFIASGVTATTTTTFKITDGAISPELKATMEDNVNKLIEAFRIAAENGDKNVKLSKDNVSKPAIEGIKQIGKRCSFS